MRTIRSRVLCSSWFVVALLLGLPTDAQNRVTLSSKAGICAIGAESHRTYLSQNDDLALAPASVQKLLVSSAALTELGQMYTSSTEVLGAERIVGGQIKRLYIRAGLDPAFTTERVYLLGRAIRGLGITSVGELVLDDSRLVESGERRGARAYVSGVSAFGLNWNSYTVRACAPEGARGTALLSIDPAEFAVQVKGAVKVGAENQFSAQEGAGGDIVSVSGFVKAGDCSEEYVAVNDTRQYTAAVLGGILRAAGVSISRSSFGEVPAAAVRLLSFQSRPLEELLRDMNYFSNNNMAEMITALLGAQGGAYSRETGLRKVQRSVASLTGIADAEKTDDWEMVDASGLSPNNRLTPRILCRVLAAQYKNPDTRTTFFASLPQFGVSGTMKKRLKGVSGRAKTGSLSTVSSLAGVVYGHSEPILFAIIQNQVPDLAAAKANEDRIIEMLAKR